MHCSRLTLAKFSSTFLRTRQSFHKIKLNETTVARLILGDVYLQSVVYNGGLVQTKLERDVRFLKIYAVCLTILVACLAAFGLCSSRKRHFKEMDVERINVREKSGKLDLVISNAERMPPAIINGKEYKNGMRSPGMLFYNGKGDEDGGMGFSSETTPDGKYHADGQLMFDQYNQDQAVGIQYNDNNGKRSAGLRVWDRPDVPIDKVMNQLEGLHGAERQATIKKLADDGMLGNQPGFRRQASR